MKKYKTSWQRTRLTKITYEDVEGETKHQVILDGGTRQNKRSSTENFFDTLLDAQNFLIDDALIFIDEKEKELREAKEYFKKVKAMK
jgi:hypothetical protein